MEKEFWSFSEIKLCRDIFQSQIKSDLLGKILDFFTSKNTANNNKEKQYMLLKDIINDNLTFDGDAIKVAIKEIITHHLTITSNEVISKISDIKVEGNYKDFITFIEEDGYDYYVIGDIHDDLYSLNQIFKGIDFVNNFQKVKLIFLGDYVDRGRDRVNVINKLIILKYLLPKNIFLLRGNHELYKTDKEDNYHSIMQGASPQGYHFDFLTYLVTAEDEKTKALRKKNKIDKELVGLYAKLFDSMSTVALFHFNEINICAAHGGLPRPNLRYKNFYENDEFINFNTLLSDETLDNIGFQQKKNMVWSDPYDGYDEAFKNTSDIRFDFSKEEFIAFCKKYDIDLFLRAHEQQSKGYKSYFGNRLISVFSSGGKNKDENEVVNKHSYYSDVSPNILKISSNEIESVNINFIPKDICKLEQKFLYKIIKKSRENQEKEYKDYSPNSNCDIDSKSNRDAIIIADCFNTKNKRVLPLSNSKPIVFTYGNLLYFSGIYKHLKFQIDPEERKITNFCNLPLLIGGENGVILKQDESVRLQEKSIVEIKDGMRLIIIEKLSNDLSEAKFKKEYDVHNISSKRDLFK